MAARANLVVNDRASTPVAHTFTPAGDDTNDVHVFLERNGVPAADSRFTAALRSTNGKWRPTLRMQIPVVQTQDVGGIQTPVVVRTAFAELNLTFDATSTEQERKNLVGMFANALAANQTMVNDLIVNLNDIY